MFYGCKIIYSKTGLKEKMFEKTFLVEKYLWLQNHWLENWFAKN